MVLFFVFLLLLVGSTTRVWCFSDDSFGWQMDPIENQKLDKYAYPLDQKEDGASSQRAGRPESWEARTKDPPPFFVSSTTLLYSRAIVSNLGNLTKSVRARAVCVYVLVPYGARKLIIVRK
jgi:hypothetical protein